MSKHPTTSIFLDKYHPKADKTCAISIRVTFNSKKRYYKTKYKLTPEDFEKLFSSKPRATYKTTITVLKSLENKAIEIIDELKDGFTWTLFEKRFVRKTGDSENVFALLEERANELRAEDRISTAVTFDCALSSLKKFHVKDKLTLDEMTVAFLRKYKKWMEVQGNSNTTTGIYLRNVRYIFKKAINDKVVPVELYPFGSDTDKFTIPTGRSIKKALPQNDIDAIREFVPTSSTESKARDFWVFSFLAGGINIKDISLLKRKNIDGKFIEFERAKTKRSNEDKPITIRFSITEEIQDIISKWGNKTINPEDYIFPILSKGITAQKEYNLIQLFTRYINDHMKAIAKKLSINVSLTTYVCRHSASTVLRNNGISIDKISQQLGHKDIKTTRTYLASFEDDSTLEIGNILSKKNHLKAV